MQSALVPNQLGLARRRDLLVGGDMRGIIGNSIPRGKIGDEKPPYYDGALWFATGSSRRLVMRDRYADTVEDGTLVGFHLTPSSGWEGYHKNRGARRYEFVDVLRALPPGEPRDIAKRMQEQLLSDMDEGIDILSFRARCRRRESADPTNHEAIHDLMKEEPSE